MDAKTKDRFTKLMALTTSDNDHEALLALRKAQNILQTENISWEGVLASKTVHIEEKKEKPLQKRECFSFDKVPRMPKNEGSKGIFRDIKKKFSILNGKTFEAETERFLKSLHTYWMLKGSLSEKQLHCLTSICLKANWKC